MGKWSAHDWSPVSTTAAMKCLLFASAAPWGCPSGGSRVVRSRGTELLPAAVVREFREETGLLVEEVGRLRQLSQHHEEGRPGTAILRHVQLTSLTGRQTGDSPRQSGQNNSLQAAQH